MKGGIREKHKIRFLNRGAFFVAAVLVISIGLLLYKDKEEKGSTPAVAQVTQIIDDTRLLGPVRIGSQKVSARILSGLYRGRLIKLNNELQGYPLTDRHVGLGDKVLLMLDIDEGEIRQAKLVDFDRKRWHLFMFALFAGLLILFARNIGVRAFVSFIFTVAVLIRFLIPLILQGYDPILVCLAFALSFGVVTLLLVGGFSIRALSAIIGFIIGILISSGLTLVAGKGMYLRGITCDWAVFLLKSGYPGLDLTKILIGSIVLGASGAMVDVAIAVATAVREVVMANPALSAGRLIRSGFEVGRAELGTMTTTLLLAYMGVNIFLIMMFAAKGTPTAGFLNITMISHEILRALSGSIGMVLIAPITAVIAGLLYQRAYGLPPAP